MGELPIADPNGGEPPNVWLHVRPYLSGLVHVGQQPNDGTPSLDDYAAPIGVHDVRAPSGTALSSQMRCIAVRMHDPPQPCT